MGKLKNIVKAYTNPAPDEEWYKERLDACISCEYNSENVPYEKLSAAHKIQKKTKTAPQGFCTLCSCPVDKKTSVKAEACALKKLGKEPKWDKMEAEAGFGFTVESFDQNISVKREATENLVDLGEIGGQKVMNFKIGIGYNPKRYHVDNTRVSCGCVTLDVGEEEEGELTLGIKLNTTGFLEGVNTKRVVVNFKNKNGKEYPTIIKIKTVK